MVAPPPAGIGHNSLLGDSPPFSRPFNGRTFGNAFGVSWKISRLQMRSLKME